MSKIKNSVSLLVFMALASFSVVSEAFEFTPSVMVYGADGKDKSQTYEIFNNQKIKLGIEVSAHAREIDPTGKEILKPTDDFTFFPKQFSLQPGERRLIKATYKGPKELSKEASYRIVAEQLNVSLAEPQNKKGVSTQLKFMFKYQTSAYVTQSEFKPDLTIKDWKVVASPQTNKASLNLIVENKGKAHRTFQDWELKLKTKEGKEVVLNKTALPDWPIFNVLALSSRSVSVPLNNPPKDITGVDLSFHD